jgi:teichuronic acid biosynthesis glycosyltransferase TuaC
MHMILYVCATTEILLNWIFMRGKLRTVTFTTLYPNLARPRHGIFIEQRLRHLMATGEVESRVVAPSAWFPSGDPRFGPWSVFGRVPAVEIRFRIPVKHPQYLLLPKVGMTSAPLTMALAARPVLQEMLRQGFDFDVIDGHYLYPEGVAAALLGLWFGKPVVLTVLGDDAIVLPGFHLPRRMILWAVRQAAGVTTVCQALKDRLVEVGAPEEKIRVVLHGVDLEKFRPVDREAVRQRLGLSGRVLLVVGHVIKRKGQHLAVQALPHLPDTTLLIAGDGWMEAMLREMARDLGVADRVRFLGNVEQEDLRGYYGAADALVLASSREGIANVLIESMACGTPVIATPVWGTPEAVSVPEAGVLMRDRSAEALVEASRRLFAEYPDRAATRRHAETFTWERTSRDHLEVLRAAAAGASISSELRTA